MFDWAYAKGQGFFRSRAQTKASNTLGVILLENRDEKKFRDPILEKYDAYYENRQYANLLPWDQSTDPSGQHIPLRRRQPRLKHAFAKTLSSRLTARLIGQSVFPTFKVDMSPDDQEFFAAIIRESKLNSFLLEPVRRTVNTGAVFVRFYLSGGAFKKQWYHAKYCYPKFQDNGELEELRIQYVYTDIEDKANDGTPKKKWYRLDLGIETETLYDNPEYKPGIEPEFQVVDSITH